jgi:hypothetical protein
MAKTSSVYLKPLHHDFFLLLRQVPEGAPNPGYTHIKHSNSNMTVIHNISMFCQNFFREVTPITDMICQWRPTIVSQMQNVQNYIVPNLHYSWFNYNQNIHFAGITVCKFTVNCKMKIIKGFLQWNFNILMNKIHWIFKKFCMFVCVFP